MKTIRFFASQWPLYFVIMLILSTFLIESIIGVLVVTLFRVELGDPILGFIVLLSTIIFLLFLLWRFEWLKEAGVTSSGKGKGWVVAFVLLVYYLFTLSYAFFGDLQFHIPVEAVIGFRIPNLVVGGIFEEILFRGAVLYALVRVWGTTKKGMLKSALTSALLFGLIHAVNVVSGDSSEVTGQIIIALFEGIWWAAIVLRWGSIWPPVLIHAVTNWVLQTKSLSIVDYQGIANSYILAGLFSLPLVALGIWWILQLEPIEPNQIPDQA